MRYSFFFATIQVYRLALIGSASLCCFLFAAFSLLLSLCCFLFAAFSLLLSLCVGNMPGAFSARVMLNGLHAQRCTIRARSSPSGQR
jgi:hypothetical protein